MSQHLPVSPVPADLQDASVAIVTAEWNGHITGPLTRGAQEYLEKYGCEAVDLYTVPGAVELTHAAMKCIDTDRYDAVIVVGCVIKGDTPHFDYVCQSVTQGVTTLNAEYDTPVIFCVLTVLDEQQALDRAGGALGNKGTEAAEAALKMVALNRLLED